MIESVADYVQRPVFPVRSGDLGIDASSLEKNLNEAFEMAAKWNAIILLDEADVFLEARRRNELLRNSLVSGTCIRKRTILPRWTGLMILAVFLRVLEYYEGIMFLTTNRIEAFDPAFKSRIHLSMKYQPLCREFRGQLWRNFIKSVPSKCRDPSVLEETFLDVLAGHNINGRQIRNMVRTAYALALSAGERLGATHIQTTLTAVNVSEDEGTSDQMSADEGAATVNLRSRKRRRL